MSASSSPSPGRPLSILRRVWQLIRIVRPLNCLIAAASVMVGAMLAAPGLANLARAAAAARGAVFVALLVCAGGYALNDCFDVASDRIVKPSRPLVGGKVGSGAAIAMAIALWGTAGIVAEQSGPVVTIFWAAWVILLGAYSWRIKTWGLAGNILVSVVSSSGFLLGAACLGRIEAGVLPASISITLHLARETAKSAADVRGDREAHLRTTAVRLGARAALRLSLWCIAAAFATSMLPLVLSKYGAAYFVAVAAGAYPLLAASLRRIILSEKMPTGDERSREAAAKSVATLLKLVMPVGLLAFFLEAI